MATKWLPTANVLDLSGYRGYGPFNRSNRKFLGVILHVNVDKNGTSDAFYVSNPGQVTPNFQVYKDGSIHQYLPVNWQPWCQVAGNFNYAAIETAGLPSEKLTDPQIAAIVGILRVYRDELGLKLQISDSPGMPGFGTHEMGGRPWGGHSCPGPLRAKQRQTILDLVAGSQVAGVTTAPDRPKPVKLAHAPMHHRPVPPLIAKGTGAYFGSIDGPEISHGGINAAERASITLIQQQLVYLGLVPGHTDINDGWADGIFDVEGGGVGSETHGETSMAVARFQRTYLPNTTEFGQVWWDDWTRLAAF
jgi:hypothetical protein